ncbi:MAG: VOC family protein [Oscillospiraceae bacterium]
MQFDFITVYVEKMEPMVQFYRDYLGLSLLRRQAIENGGELAFFGEEGQPSIEVISSPANAGRSYDGFSIGIAVENLDEAVDKLAKLGHPIHRGPISPSPGTRFSFLRDPSGIEVQLIEHSS